MQGPEKRKRELKTPRMQLAPHERAARVRKAARAIQQGTDYAAMRKRGYGKDEITEARKMLGLHHEGDQYAKEDDKKNRNREPSKNFDSHGNPLLL